MSFEETDKHQFFGLDYAATDKQSRTIVCKIRLTPEWLHWHALDTRVKHIHVHGDNLEVIRNLDEGSRALAKALAEAEAKVSQKAAQIIDEVLEGHG